MEMRCPECLAPEISLSGPDKNGLISCKKCGLWFELDKIKVSEDIVMDEKQAHRFFHDWLWESPKRTTEGMPWEGEYQNDVIQMLMDATEEAQTQINALTTQLTSLQQREAVERKLLERSFYKLQEACHSFSTPEGTISLLDEVAAYLTTTPFDMVAVKKETTNRLLTDFWSVDGIGKHQTCPYCGKILPGHFDWCITYELEAAIGVKP